MTSQPLPTCTTCLTPLTTPHLLIETHPLCHPCFRHLFTLALTSESHHPAHWGNQPLSASRYAHILGPSLLQAYEAKSHEYATPVCERVFCARTDPPRRPEACGNFVGKWQEVKRCVRCEVCKWYTCLRCEESFSTGDVAGAEVEIEHECDASRKEELEERAFRGLVRGVEWQVCPNGNCKRRVELREGCNHVVCACGVHFCFVCGEFVRDGMGHWREKGGCPRFGRRGDERAIFDDGDFWDDNDEVGDEERARRIQDQENAGGEGADAVWRAFEVQMRMVEDARRDLRRREAERAGPKSGGGSEGQEEGGERRRRRRRRRKQRDGRDQVEEQPMGPQRREHLVPQQAASGDSTEPRPRRRRGIRAFLNDAIDATEFVLFGGPPPRRG